MAEPLPVLMYHGLHDGPDDEGRYDPVYSVRPADFAAQLDWLAREGYRCVTLRELASVPRDARVAVITFDDGDVTNYTVALPLLENHGFRAEIFVTSDFVDQAGMLSRAQLRELAARGQSVQSHGQSHRYLATLDDAALRDELATSRARLSEWSGSEVDAIAFPGGRGAAREAALAKSLGYRTVLGSVPGPNRDRDAAILERIAITRGLALDRFASLVRWRGIAPQTLRMRHDALALAKRLLGNGGYERLRARILGS